MMNEFPPKFMEVMREASGGATPPVNVTEYLEYLGTLGLTKEAFPAVQPAMQSAIWSKFSPGDGPDRLARAIDACKKDDPTFHMEGGSWTNDISWVRGYENLLKPMEAVSALFSERVLSSGVAPSDTRFRNALFHLLMSQTSCYRYWGEGTWTDYGKELSVRFGSFLVLFV